MALAIIGFGLFMLGYPVAGAVLCFCGAGFSMFENTVKIIKEL
jgi:hypothetical protein